MSLGVDVVVLDGHVAVNEGDGFTITEAGELVVFDSAKAEVARFKVGEWLTATRRLRGQST